MKLPSIFAALFVSTSVFAQVSPVKPLGTPSLAANIHAVDSSFRVVYADSNQTHRPMAYSINGRFIKSLGLPAFKALDIESINVQRGDTLVDNVLYSGQLHIYTKKGQSPKLITLTGLKDKYTSLKGQAVVFTLDGALVDDDYDDYFVDENSLLTIIIDRLKLKIGNTPCGLIKLLTKTEANIKARNQIMIRGSDRTMQKLGSSSEFTFD
jgi:hypothetical protein